MKDDAMRAEIRRWVHIIFEFIWCWWHVYLKVFAYIYEKEEEIRK